MSKAYENYIEEFKDFFDQYDAGLAGPGKISSTGGKFVRYMAECGKESFTREILYNLKRKEISMSNDENTGKPMAVNKADIIADASDEYKNYKQARNDYDSIKEMVASLARLQKAAMGEMDMAGV